MRCLKINIQMLMPTLLCLALFCSKGFCQRVEVGKLRPIISTTKASTENITHLLELSEAYLTVNTDSALICGNAALKLSKQISNKKLEAGSYIAIGQAYDYVNQQTIALEYLLQARTVYEEIKEDSGLAASFYSIAEMYNTLRESFTARMNYHKALGLFTKLNNEYEIANIYGSLGNSFFRSNMFDSALYYNNLGLVIGRRRNDTTILLDVLGNLADVYIGQGKLEQAMGYLNEANLYADMQGNYYCIAYGKGQLAKIAIAKKDVARAVGLANEMAAIGRMLKMDDLLMDAAEVKYKAFKLSNHTDSTLFYMEQYMRFADTLTGRTKYLALDSLLNTYRFSKKQKEMELLKQTNKSNTILLVYSGFALLILCCFMLFMVKRSRERKKLNHQLQQQAEKLQTVNQLKDKMFSIIGHDLRGPVASLKGLVDFMKDNSLSNEDSEMVVRELRQSVNSVDVLLENLLVWAKMQMQGDIVSLPETIKVHSIVDETVQLYQKASSLKNIQLKYELEDGLTVFADRNYLSLILRNLVNNAIKFTPDNGSVNITAETENNQAKICVADNGIGMDKEETDKLFNLEKPFTTRGTMNEKGSGLGLLFVKEYTERCGGKFSITSEKGKGSRFCITLNKN